MADMLGWESETEKAARRSKWMRWAFFGLLAFIAFCIFAIIVGNSLPDGQIQVQQAAAPKQTQQYGKWSDAYDAAIIWVQIMALKSPSTALFANNNQCRVSDYGFGHYQIHAFVDSQNSFGGMMRTYFIVDAQSCVKPGSIRIEGDIDRSVSTLPWKIIIQILDD